MKLYAARVESMTLQREETLVAMLDSDRKEKVHNIKNHAERSRSIYAGLLLRHAYFMAGHADFESVKMKKGEHGKPYIEGCFDFCYSLSHSGEWVLCAADEREVGADIQQFRPYREAIAKRFFHEKEWERLVKKEDEQERKTEFYRIWTAKEAYAKLTGRGIGAGMGLTQESYRQVSSEDGTAFLKIYQTIPEYPVAVCSWRDDFPEEIELMRDGWLRMEDAADGKW